MKSLMHNFSGDMDNSPFARHRPGARHGPAPERSPSQTRINNFDRYIKHSLEPLSRRLERREMNKQLLELAARIDQLRVLSRDEQANALSHLRQRLCVNRYNQSTLLDALAHACVVAEYTLNLIPRDGQCRAAVALLLGRFVEMPTGEGKTLTTALCAAVTALDGTPVHVLTANDYLAQRDTTRLAPLYSALGLSCACVLPTMDDDDRRHAYSCNVVHLTGKQSGFDWMRDALALGPDAGSLVARLRALTRPRSSDKPTPLQRGLCAAILDEADSLLIDEARIPLVLAAPQASGKITNEGSIALSLAQLLCPVRDYQMRLEQRQVTLTEVGSVTLANLAQRVPGVWKSTRFRNERVRQALAALHLWERDHDYVVRDGRVLLVDQQTGRAMPDRRLQHGLHGLLELKEQCLQSADSETVASIACQNFFLRYKKLVGTSGTLSESRAELARVYDASLVQVAPAKPSRLTVLPTLVFQSRAEQLDALIEEVRRALACNRPTLIGTRSVEHSRAISAMLTAHRICHQVLDASQSVDEAALVAKAGRAGQVTVATNMAGRGTDIPLGIGVADRGGLHLVSLAFNDSRRVDRQLVGRTARQGEPGSFRQLWTLDEPILVARLPRFFLALTRRVLGHGDPSGIGLAFTLCVVKLTQRRIEWRHAAERRAALTTRNQIARHVAFGGHPEHPA